MIVHHCEIQLRAMPCVISPNVVPLYGPILYSWDGYGDENGRARDNCKRKDAWMIELLRMQRPKEKLWVIRRWIDLCMVCWYIFLQI
jgi:hypothetical protein